MTLQNRASSIVAREMRELLDGAFKTCEDALARQNPPTKASGAASAEVFPASRALC